MSTNDGYYNIPLQLLTLLGCILTVHCIGLALFRKSGTL
jgi:hypothetical protein